MDIINQYNAIPLGMLTGLIIGFVIGAPLLNRYLDRISKPKTCKKCGSTELTHYAGIGASGVMCTRCRLDV